MLTLFTFPFCVVVAKPNQSEGDYYQTLLKLKFPIERKATTYVGYRYSHAPVPGDLEYSFVIDYGKIGNEGEARITADVHLAETASIYEQMSALRRKYPKMHALVIVRKLRVRSFHLTEQNCPAVRVEFEDFRKLEFPAPRFDFVSPDAPNHEFRIISSTGDMTFEWIDEGYPLVRWALETRRAFESCISNGAATDKPKN